VDDEPASLLVTHLIKTVDNRHIETRAQRMSPQRCHQAARTPCNNERSLQQSWRASYLLLEKIPQQYLLWGERAKHHNSNGWLQLSTARIGSLNVPLPDDFSQGQRVYLKTVEYLAEVDDFGNVSVIDERLVKLEAK
jgi:hypothetical protein